MNAFLKDRYDMKSFDHVNLSSKLPDIQTETIKGKDFNVADKIVENFLNMIKNNEKIKINSLDEDQKTTITSLSGVKEFPMRVKCATMAWHTFVSATK